VNSGLDTLADIDEGSADQVADILTDRVQEVVEGTDPNTESNNERRSVEDTQISVARSNFKS
jgi:hypothetical protein